MREVKIGDEVRVIDCNSASVFIHDKQFHKDILTDLGEIVKSERELGMTPILPLVRLFWTCEKSATLKTPDFEAWYEKLPSDGLTLDGVPDENGIDPWAKGVVLELKQQFFRNVQSDMVSIA